MTEAMKQTEQKLKSGNVTGADALTMADSMVRDARLRVDELREVVEGAEKDLAEAEKLKELNLTHAADVTIVTAALRRRLRSFGGGLWKGALGGAALGALGGAAREFWSKKDEDTAGARRARSKAKRGRSRSASVKKRVKRAGSRSTSKSKRGKSAAKRRTSKTSKKSKGKRKAKSATRRSSKRRS